MKARDLLLYHTQDQKVKVSVYFQDGSFWLTQKGMAELFGVNVPAINKHLNNIFESGELEQKSTVFILETVQLERSAQSIFGEPEKINRAPERAL